MTIFLDVARNFIIKEINEYIKTATAKNKNKIYFLRNKVFSKQKINIASELIQDLEAHEDQGDDEKNFDQLNKLLTYCLANSALGCSESEIRPKNLEDALPKLMIQIKLLYQIFSTKDLLSKAPLVSPPTNERKASFTPNYESAYNIFCYYSAFYYLEKYKEESETGLMMSAWYMLVGTPINNRQDLDITLKKIQQDFENSDKAGFDEASQIKELNHNITQLLLLDDQELKKAMGKALEDINKLPLFSDAPVLNNINNQKPVNANNSFDDAESERRELLQELNLSPSVFEMPNNNNKKKSKASIINGIENTLHGKSMHSKSKPVANEERNERASHLTKS